MVQEIRLNEAVNDIAAEARPDALTKAATSAGARRDFSLVRPSEIIPDLACFDQTRPFYQPGPGPGSLELIAYDAHSTPALGQLWSGLYNVLQEWDWERRIADTWNQIKGSEQLSHFTGFSGQMVVDLGAGTRSVGFLLAAAAGAAAYIGVEDRRPEDLARALSYTIGKLQEHNLPSAAVVANTMGSVIRHLPHDSVSLLISGIDDLICPVSEMDIVAANVGRVLHPTGLAAIYDSQMTVENLSCRKFNIGAPLGLYSKAGNV